MPRRSRLPVMLLAAGICTSGVGCAPRAYPYRRADYPQQRFERRAWEAGYREGLEHGRDDARHGREFSFARHHEDGEANQGYDRDDTSRPAYRSEYRQGFRAGYREGFNRVAGAGAFKRPEPR
jgi:hypothetical protein